MPAYYLEIIIAGLAVVLLMLEAFLPKGQKTFTAYASLLGLAVTFALLFFAKGPSSCGCASHFWDRFYTIDGHVNFYKGLILICAFSVTLLSLDFRKILARYTEDPDSDANTGEFYPLILLATAGMMWMVSAKDLVWIFVSLELTTITFYILVAYLRRNVGSLEAGVKYLILGALSTGILVYGIAWVYGMTGSTNLAAINDFIAHQDKASSGLLFGLALLVLAIGFKVGAAPMQLWIPDVYQGAPTPITTFLSVGSKASGFAVGIAILTPFLSNPATAGAATLILTVMTCLTLVIGNLAAIGQSNFKRLLAYSSIAHAGFILMAICSWNADSSPRVVAFYLATYLIMTVGAFFILSFMRQAEDSEEIDAYRGLGKRSPFLAFSLTILLCSMAGLPLTAGFWGKLLAFQHAIDAGNWAPVIVGFIAVGAGFYYYLKTVAAMYWSAPTSEKELNIPIITKVYVSLAVIATLVIGIYPKAIMNWL